MDVIVEDIAPLLLCTLMFLVFLIGSFNVIFMLKSGFYVKVNCWFCNQNTKVLFSERNSFDCPYCQQYNGFDKNGDYNKIITAQHTGAFNISKSTTSSGTNFNGLCNTCNNNISLKVTQLAKYEPLDERNYDIEIEHFKKQLEKTYRLCRSCKKHVDSTIKRHNAWMFAHRLKNRKKTKNTTTQGMSRDLKPGFWQIILKVFPLVLIILTIMSISGFSTNIVKDNINFYMPKSIKLTEFYKLVSNTFSLNLDLKNKPSYLPKILKINEASLLVIIGLIWEITVQLVEWTSPSVEKISKILSWMVLILTTMAHFAISAIPFVNTTQIASYVWLLYNYAVSFINSIRRKSRRKFVLKRLSGNASQEEYSDIEEESSLDDSMSSISRNISNSALNGSNGISGKTRLSASRKSLNNSAKLKKTSSLFNIKLNNERLTDPHNFITAQNRDLHKDFIGLNLGAFEKYSSFNSSSHSVRNFNSNVNPFMLNNTMQTLPKNGFLNNSFNSSSSYRSNGLRSPFLNSPLSNLFLNIPTEDVYTNNQVNLNNSFSSPKNAFYTNNQVNLNNTFTSPNSVLNSPKLRYSVSSNTPHLNNSFASLNTVPTSPYLGYSVPALSPRESLVSANCFSAFKPISEPQNSICNYSTRSILSPPKLVNNIRENEQLVFSMSANTPQHNNVTYWPSHRSTVHKNFTNNLNNFESANYIGKLVESSRSSSRSSGFLSGNELPYRADSLPNSRSQSPDHIKLD